MAGQLVRRKKKKLEDAAHYWLRGGSSYSEAINDLRAFGAPDDVIAELETAQRQEDFEVWPENWAYVEMFLRMQTQWRTSMSGIIGLDYCAAKFMFDVYGVEDHKGMMDALMIIERVALELLNKGSE